MVAKGKKLGALVGFTFRQPAILHALALPSNSRELGSYLMYEPFQRAWTQTVKPSQTVTLCEGGGVMYRHPRVHVTLWLDHYVKEIYPDWTRRGSALLELAKLASQRQPLNVLTSQTMKAAPTSAIKAAPSSVIKAAPTSAFKATPSSVIKAARGSAFKAAPTSAFKAASSSVIKAAWGSAFKAAPTSASSRTPVVIDLTSPPRATKPNPLKRKRLFVKPSQLVEINAEDRGRKGKAKRVRTSFGGAKLEGEGTEADPYIL